MNDKKEKEEEKEKIIKATGKEIGETVNCTYCGNKTRLVGEDKSTCCLNPYCRDYGGRIDRVG